MDKRIIELGNGRYKVVDGVESLTDENIFEGIQEQIQLLRIPASVINISPNVFSGLKNLKSFLVAKNNKTYKSSFSGILYKGKTLVKLPPANTSVSFNVIYDHINEIGEYAFSSCNNLEQVILNKNINNIPDYAFKDCNQLKSIEFSEAANVKTIGDGAFEGCVELEKIILPMSLENIFSGAFRACDKLNTVVLPDRFFDCNKSLKPEYRGIIDKADNEIPKVIKSYGDYIKQKDENIELLTAAEYESSQRISSLTSMVEQLSQNDLQKMYVKVEQKVTKTLTKIMNDINASLTSAAANDLRKVLETFAQYLCKIFNINYTGFISTDIKNLKPVFSANNLLSEYEKLEVVKDDCNPGSHAKPVDEFFSESSPETSFSNNDALAHYSTLCRFFKNVFPTLCKKSSIFSDKNNDTKKLEQPANNDINSTKPDGERISLPELCIDVLPKTTVDDVHDKNDLKNGEPKSQSSLLSSDDKAASTETDNSFTDEVKILNVQRDSLIIKRH